MRHQDMKTGDNLTFRACTREYGNAKATRKIRGFRMHVGRRLRIFVTYHGWTDFEVRMSECIAVNGEDLE